MVVGRGEDLERDELGRLAAGAVDERDDARARGRRADGEVGAHVHSHPARRGRAVARGGRRRRRRGLGARVVAHGRALGDLARLADASLRNGSFASPVGGRSSASSSSNRGAPLGGAPRTRAGVRQRVTSAARSSTASSSAPRASTRANACGTGAGSPPSPQLAAARNASERSERPTRSRGACGGGGAPPPSAPAAAAAAAGRGGGARGDARDDVLRAAAQPAGGRLGERGAACALGGARARELERDEAGSPVCGLTTSGAAPSAAGGAASGARYTAPAQPGRENATSAWPLIGAHECTASAAL